MLLPLVLLSTVAPSFSPTGPEAAHFGQAANFPVGSPDTWEKPEYLVGSYSHYDSIFPTRRVARSKSPWRFRRAASEPQVSYSFRGSRYTLRDYLAHFPVTGLLILKGDTLLCEHYQYGRTDADRFTSQSMAKSVMSLLVGIALGEGRIRSLGETASAYAGPLRGTAYGETTLRDLLHMSSGVGEGGFSPRATMVPLLARCVRRHPPGTKFHYSGGDSETVGIALRRAAGTSLSDYLEQRIWQPIGAEADAAWAVDPTGQEYTFAGFNAVLRDYARLGRLLAYDGAWNGRQIVPRQYLIDATTLRPGDAQVAPGAATPYYGYGYQIWIFPGPRRMFVLRGSQSQYVFVDPESKLVFVQAAVRSEAPDAENGRAEALALWLAMDRQL